MKTTALPVMFVASLSLSPANAESSEIPEAVKKHCAADYKKFCSQHTLESDALKYCMDRNGLSLSANCVNALIDAGMVSRSEVERRRKLSKP